MPIRRRKSKRTAAAAIEPRIYEGIRAGLLGLPCPSNGNAFAHLEATHPGRGAPRDDVRVVYESLPWPDRERADDVCRRDGRRTWSDLIAERA